MANPTGIAAHSLGGLLGAFSPTVLVEELGQRWDIGLGYFKRHASCAFTHPTADAALVLRPQLPDAGVDAITGIRVSTYSAAANLHRTRWNNRLAAMFSIPYVVATALRDGRVAPDGYDASNSAEFRALADRVDVVADAVFDDRLPDARGAAVEITLADGRVLREEVANPIGDAAREPFDYERTVALLRDLLGDGDAVARVLEAASSLPETPSARAVLDTLTES
ncbi:hypothetical protein ACFOJ6_02495 [Gordonia humi]